MSFGIMKNILLLICSIFTFTAFAQVVNGSFESGSLPDLLGWEWTCGAESINNAPPTGGSWCIKVAGGNVKGCFPGYAYQKIPSITNGQTFTLTGWAYTETPKLIGLYFGTINKGVITLQAGDTTTSAAWKPLSVQSTFTLAIGDTAVVVLFGGIAGGPFQGYGYFDLVNLEELTGLITIGQNRIFNVSPNPFSNQTILKSAITLHDASFHIYDVNGQLVKQAHHISGQTYALDRSDLQNGLYFLQVVQDAVVIGAAKIIISDFQK